MVAATWARTIRVLAVVGLLSPLASSTVSAAPEKDPLQRRAFLGTAVKPMTDEERDERKLPATLGVEVANVIPDSSAAEAGVKAGDVIVAVDGAEIHDTREFVQKIAGRKGGTTLKLSYFRDGAKADKELKLKSVPLESKEGRNTIYGEVATREGRLRTIVTKPDGKHAGKRPALFLIQGIGTFTIEAVPGGIEGYSAIIDDFSSRGFVTCAWTSPAAETVKGALTRR